MKIFPSINSLRDLEHDSVLVSSGFDIISTQAEF